VPSPADCPGLATNTVEWGDASALLWHDTHRMSSKAIGKGQRRRRLVHAAMDAYLDWGDECTAVSDAYRCWAEAGEADTATAWRAYEVALDREERASVVYADLVEHVGGLTAPERKPSTGLAVSGEALR
jgi:hypothetical protein